MPERHLGLHMPGEASLTTSCASQSIWRPICRHSLAAAISQMTTVAPMLCTCQSISALLQAEGVAMPERHLGLHMPGEASLPRDHIVRIAEHPEAHVDANALLATAIISSRPVMSQRGAQSDHCCRLMEWPCPRGIWACTCLGKLPCHRTTSCASQSTLRPMWMLMLSWLWPDQRSHPPTWQPCAPSLAGEHFALPCIFMCVYSFQP